MTISLLSLIIIFKIVVTFFLVCLPFLVMPKRRLEQIAGVTAEKDTFFRLYGIAIFALLIGYATAFPQIHAGQFPWGVAIMGVVSNGGASLILMLGVSAIAKRVFVPVYGLICLGLVASMVWPEFVIKPLA